MPGAGGGGGMGGGGGNVAGFVLGALQAVSGFDAKNKAKNEAKLLSKTRPQISRDPNADANLALVKSDLAKGMSSKAEKAYNDIADRQFSSSLSALLKGGGDINSIGDLYGSSEEGRQQLAVMQDQLRLNQIKNVLYQSQVTDERNTITPFQVNQFAPWADKSAANAAALYAADQRMWQGLGTVASSFGGGGKGGGGGSQSGTSGSPIPTQITSGFGGGYDSSVGRNIPQTGTYMPSAPGRMGVGGLNPQTPNTGNDFGNSFWSNWRRI